ncbi:hypothetical protein [Goodfellowiella coeruleoviolacea]|uniref:hypothetical protein n=1 Tax=Goodfellowiella coeruleoviolacea TaxID=334858 RepID=UPI0020A40900|nr:hypothetical protein [Goodfellowiella coeruleoviolacea]
MTLVYEYDRSDLHDHRMAAPAGSTVRINVGFLGEHVSYSEQQAAASLASSAAAVEIVGSGPGARWLAEAVARQLAEWRDHNAL